jgi:hypothetical protein
VKPGITAGVVAVRFLVVLILGVCRRAQICDAVASLAAIFMIDLFRRPGAVRERENDAVRHDHALPAADGQADLQISAARR